MCMHRGKAVSERTQAEDSCPVPRKEAYEKPNLLTS